MKFEGDHWRDKRYIAISEELEKAGFDCVRADQIRTSGPVVDEVCRLLREAELVVIDSSGGSHSVSYEIGYCHGIGRDVERTLLLNEDSAMPFNYRHFRHRVYRDLRHLRRLIRDYLKISEPTYDFQYGYVFTYSFTSGFGYIGDAAICIFNALQKLNFTGRVDVYSWEHFVSIEKLFSVGLMIRMPGRDPTPTYDWWKKLSALVQRESRKFSHSIQFDDLRSELAAKIDMRSSGIASGAAEFDSGVIGRVLDDLNGEGLIHQFLNSRKAEGPGKKKARKQAGVASAATADEHPQ